MAYVLERVRKKEAVPEFDVRSSHCMEALTKTTENISHDSRLLGMNPTVNHNGTKPANLFRHLFFLLFCGWLAVSRTPYPSFRY
jgi:hypothetical protein